MTEPRPSYACPDPEIGIALTEIRMMGQMTLKELSRLADHVGIQNHRVEKLERDVFEMQISARTNAEHHTTEIERLDRLVRVLAVLIAAAGVTSGIVFYALDQAMK